MLLPRFLHHYKMQDCSLPLNLFHSMFSAPTYAVLYSILELYMFMAFRRNREAELHACSFICLDCFCAIVRASSGTFIQKNNLPIEQQESLFLVEKASEIVLNIYFFCFKANRGLPMPVFFTRKFSKINSELFMYYMFY